MIKRYLNVSLFCFVQNISLDSVHSDTNCSLYYKRVTNKLPG